MMPPIAADPVFRAPARAAAAADVGLSAKRPGEQARSGPMPARESVSSIVLSVRSSLMISPTLRSDPFPVRR